MTQSLDGLSILVVEDEIIIGLMLCKEISSAGGNPIGPVNSVMHALKEIELQIVDLVVLDAKLVDGSGADLAGHLSERGIPYVVTSGYERATLPQVLRDAPFVAKPISIPVLIDAIDPALRPASQSVGAK